MLAEMIFSWLEALKPRAPVGDEQLRVANNVNEQDMPNLEFHV